MAFDQHSNGRLIGRYFESDRLVTIPSGLYLEPMLVEHAAWVKHLMSERICRNLTIPPINSIASACAFIQGKGLLVTARFAVYHQEAGLVGGTGYYLFNGKGGRSARLSYWVAEPYQGRGYGYGALAFTLKHLQALGIRYFEARVYVFNVPSQNLLLRSGFKCMDEKQHPQSDPLQMWTFVRDECLPLPS